MEFKTANTHNIDKMNLCNKHAKALIFLATGFGWQQYRTNSNAGKGWYNGCDYGRNAHGKICNAPAKYLFERREKVEVNQL
jgi:hypothetical protein